MGPASCLFRANGFANGRVHPACFSSSAASVTSNPPMISSASVLAKYPPARADNDDLSSPGTALATHHAVVQVRWRL
jgi:hypothetical protein